MRAVPSSIASILDDDTLDLAICASVMRTDGVILGFTSASESLTIDGQYYEAVHGMQASAITQSADQGIDNLQVTGLLSADRVTEVDIRKKKYSNATVEIFMCDYNDVETTGDIVTCFVGRVGDIEVTDSRYKMQCRSLSQLLSQQIGEVTTATCRVRILGDHRCNVDLSLYRFTRAVVTVIDSQMFTMDNVVGTDGVGNNVRDIESDGTCYFDYGTIKFVTGQNSGITLDIFKSTPLTGNRMGITTIEPFPYPIAITDQAIMTAGCNRVFATCISKFANWKNFRGEPHMAGNDAMTRQGKVN